MKQTFFHQNGASLSRALNTLALAGICAILGLAFLWQIAYRELPCPLCLLQRVAFVLVGMGLLLNVRFGPSPLHYGIILLSALGGAFVAGRQVLLHIAPGDPGYGSAFIGMHFYTWAFIAFVVIMVWVGLMLIVDRHATDQPSAMPFDSFTGFLLWLFFLLVVGNVASTLLECGFGPCADNPVAYMWFS
jgi:disulfide bond formation protein DsbB